jgi:hypothetical protein
MTTKTRSPREICDVVITDEFFVPLTAIYERRDRCRVFLGIWKKFGLHVPKTPWFEVPTPHIVRAVRPCKQKDALMTARIIASIVAWFGTSVGYCFLEKLFAGVNRDQSHWQSCDNANFAISLWSIENSSYGARLGQKPRQLQAILQTSENRAPLSALQLDTAENFMTYLATTDGGHTLLLKLELAAKSLQEKMALD